MEGLRDISRILLWAFYIALAVVFVWVSVVHRDRSGVIQVQDEEERKGWFSVIRRKQRIARRFDDE